VDLLIEFRAGVPLRRQLEGALRGAIRSGRLAPGSVLPPSRDLADQLGVSRGVVVDSYSQLTAEGYLSAKRGSGTRVAELGGPGRPPRRRPVSPPERFRYDLRPGLADYHAFPRARWKAALVRALRELPDTRLTYASHRGVAELRNAVAEYLGRMRGVVVEPEYVVVCCAASQALTVLWHVLRRHGARRVAIEDPGWRWQRYTVEQAGLEAVPVRVDADGLVVTELAAADVDAVVMTPAHHYPTGVVMSAQRRSALRRLLFPIHRKAKRPWHTSEKHDYEFADDFPLIGKNYYRLTSVDFDSYQEAFNVIVQEYSGQKDLQISPNPTDGHLVSLHFNFDESNGQLIIYDNLGSVVGVYPVSESGTISFANALTNGIYLAKYSSPSFTKTIRF